MSIKNIKPSGRVFEPVREVFYHPIGDSSGGYGFEINESGEYVRDAYWQEKSDQEWQEHLARRLERIATLEADEGWMREIREYETSHWEFAEWECYCGATVYGNGPGADMTCRNCNRMFNASGQELNPNIEEWGSETGEHYLDVYNSRGPRW